MRALLPLTALFLGGCVTGPVRYTSLGKDKFATLEFAERVSAPVVPLAITGGILTDAGVATGDTVAFAALIPYSAVAYTVDYFFQRDASERSAWQTLATPVIIPVMMIYLPLMTIASPEYLARDLGWEEGPYGEPDEYTPRAPSSEVIVYPPLNSN